MAQVGFSYPDKYIEDILYIHPNSLTVNDPAWVDPEDGTLAPQIAAYSDTDWIDRYYMLTFRNDVKQSKAKRLRDIQPELNLDDIL
jgi:hypothetical protein